MNMVAGFKQEDKKYKCPKCGEIIIGINIMDCKCCGLTSNKIFPVK